MGRSSSLRSAWATARRLDVGVRVRARGNHTANATFTPHRELQLEMLHAQSAPSLQVAPSTPLVVYGQHLRDFYSKCTLPSLHAQIISLLDLKRDAAVRSTAHSIGTGYSGAVGALAQTATAVLSVEQRPPVPSVVEAQVSSEQGDNQQHNTTLAAGARDQSGSNCVGSSPNAAVEVVQKAAARTSVGAARKRTVRGAAQHAQNENDGEDVPVVHTQGPDLTKEQREEVRAAYMERILPKRHRHRVLPARVSE